jgi:osmotically-inducible protein OsmY
LTAQRRRATSFFGSSRRHFSSLSDRHTAIAMTNSTLHHLAFSALEKNAHLRGRRLHLEANEGCVTIRGELPSYFEKQLAQEAIRHVDGVQRITNEVVVCQA